MDVVDYYQPRTPKVHRGELHQLTPRVFFFTRNSGGHVPCLPFDVTSCSLKARFLMRISPFEYSRAKKQQITKEGKDADA